MPTLTAARGHKRGSSVKVDYDAIWELTNPGNISHDGQGVYSYVGNGGHSEEDIGTVRTLRPLNPSGGLSSFEVTIINTGEGVALSSQATPTNWYSLFVGVAWEHG